MPTHTFPGLQLPDVRLLQTMAYLMPDFSWSRTNDDWDAPMRLGVSGETSIRLDSRQRLWLVKGPEMTLDNVRERLSDALAEFTHRQFLKGFTEDHRSLVGALNSLHWGLATAGQRGVAADEVLTTGRHGQTWLSLYTRRDADKQTASHGWAQVPWPTVDELLAAEPAWPFACSR